MSKLAIDGGKPVRFLPLPYGKQSISESDIEAVSYALRGDYLTTGPWVGQFEDALRRKFKAEEVVAVSSGTAALHCAAYALGIQPGDEVIVSPITFLASVNTFVHLGAKPVFCDTTEELLIDPVKVEELITPNTKAIVAVDFAGNCCNYESLRSIADVVRVPIVQDACHAPGAKYNGFPVGSLNEITTFSFHPVKHFTTGEGGAVLMQSISDFDVTEKRKLCERFRNHGMDRDHHSRAEENTWEYLVEDIGLNYRLTDFQSALGFSQLSRLEYFLAKRRELARLYQEGLSEIDSVSPLSSSLGEEHAYHLFVVELELEKLSVDRAAVFRALRAEGILTTVHYQPIHLQPYYQSRFGYKPGDFEVAERKYQTVLSLPLFPEMEGKDVRDVLEALRKVLGAYKR